MSKWCLTTGTYVDDLLASFKSGQEYFDIGSDIANAASRVGLKVKYMLTSSKVDPNVLVKNGRMGDNLENIIGLVWDLNEDTAAPNINLNVFGKKRGNQMDLNSLIQI